MRLLSLHKLYLYKTDPKDLVKIDASIARELQTMLARHGYYQGLINGEYDDATRAALRALVHRENLEERERMDDMIDGVVLRFLRERFGE